MSRQKLYIGRRVRQLRVANGATQASFASQLGISTSYLNQIENNQRPVSASVLVSLMESFRLDISDVRLGEGDRLVSALTEIGADPIFEGLGSTSQEFKLVAQSSPNFARMLVICHRAYRQSREELANFDQAFGSAQIAFAASPYEEVRDYFHFVDNYIHDADTAAEQLAGDLGLHGCDPAPILIARLAERHNVRVALAGHEAAIRRFDPNARILFLNGHLPTATRNFQIAFQIARFEMDSMFRALIQAASFKSREAEEISQIGLCNYFAGSLLMPYAAFLEIATKYRYDLELTANHFCVSIEQVAHRLSTLQRPGAKGIPFFFARIDRAGNITKRHSANRFQFARYGGACPLWNAHEAFERPGQFLRQLAETPDGVRYLSIAVELNKARSGFGTPRRRYAIALGCEVGFAPSIVYGDGLDVAARTSFDQIGISCRICERACCPQRAVPPINVKLDVAPDDRTVLPYRIRSSADEVKN